MGLDALDLRRGVGRLPTMPGFRKPKAQRPGPAEILGLLEEMRQAGLLPREACAIVEDGFRSEETGVATTWQRWAVSVASSPSPDLWPLKSIVPLYAIAHEGRFLGVGSADRWLLSLDGDEIGWAGLLKRHHLAGPWKPGEPNPLLYTTRFALRAIRDCPTRVAPECDAFAMQSLNEARASQKGCISMPPRDICGDDFSSALDRVMLLRSFLIPPGNLFSDAQDCLQLCIGVLVERLQAQGVKCRAFLGTHEETTANADALLIRNTPFLTLDGTPWTLKANRMDANEAFHVASRQNPVAVPESFLPTGPHALVHHQPPASSATIFCELDWAATRVRALMFNETFSSPTFGPPLKRRL